MKKWLLGLIAAGAMVFTATPANAQYWRPVRRAYYGAYRPGWRFARPYYGYYRPYYYGSYYSPYYSYYGYPYGVGYTGPNVSFWYGF